jgi:hypothetical protein
MNNEDITALIKGVGKMGFTVVEVKRERRGSKRNPCGSLVSPEQAAFRWRHRGYVARHTLPYVSFPT